LDISYQISVSIIENKKLARATEDCSTICKILTQQYFQDNRNKYILSLPLKFQTHQNPVFEVGTHLKKEKSITKAGKRQKQNDAINFKYKIKITMCNKRTTLPSFNLTVSLSW
jgi:hypothetical protein